MKLAEETKGMVISLGSGRDWTLTFDDSKRYVDTCKRLYNMLKSDLLLRKKKLFWDFANPHPKDKLERKGDNCQKTTFI